MTVKIIGKEVSNAQGKFTAYAVLTSKGNWFRTAKVDPQVLKKFDGEVATVSVSRKFDKKVVSGGVEKSFPTLVIEEVVKPTEADLQAFNEALDKINNETLADVE